MSKQKPEAKQENRGGVGEIIRQNQLAGRETYDGLTSSEIGEHNRRLMFGDNDESMPDRAEWSRIVD